MPNRSLVRWLLQVVGLVAVCGSLLLVATYWSELPERIPTHYGASGTPNGWGGKKMLWLLVGVQAGLYVVMTTAMKYRKLISIPVEINRDAPEVKELLAEMMMVLKAIITLIFGWIIWRTIQTALGQASGVGGAFLPVSLLGTLAPSVLYILQLLKYQR